MTTLITNNAVAALSANITSGSSSFSVQTGQGAKFPAPGVGEQAFITLIAPVAGVMEIVKYTSRTGDTFSGLTRGVDGTTAAAFTAGDAVELRVVAATYDINGIAPNQTGQDGKFLKSVSLSAQWTQITNTDVSGLGTLATQNGTFSGTSSGNNTGDQTINLSGDVTGVGTGPITTAIGPNKVTLAMLVQIATARFLGRNTAGTGNVEEMTAAQVKALLGIVPGDVTGLAAIASTGSANDLSGGTVPAGRMPAFTGDVTNTAGALATTISPNAVQTTMILANAVTLAKLAQMATASFHGRITAGTGNVEVLSAAQAKSVLAIAQADVAGLTTASSPTFAGVNVAGAAVFKDNVWLDAVGATVPSLVFSRNSTLRWQVIPAGAESSGNAGSNLALYSFADNGSFLGVPLYLDRATGNVSLAAGLTITGGLFGSSANFSAAVVAKTVNFTAFTVTTTTGAVAVNFSNGQKQKLTTTGNVSALTFSFPGAGHYQLVMVTGANTVAFPTIGSTFQWLGATAAPTLNTGTYGGVLNLYYDGTMTIASYTKIGAV